MATIFKIQIQVLTLTLSLYSAGCAFGTKQAPLSRNAERSTTLHDDEQVFNRVLQKHFGLWNDKKADRFLNNIFTRLVESNRIAQKDESAAGFSNNLITNGDTANSPETLPLTKGTPEKLVLLNTEVPLNQGGVSSLVFISKGLLRDIEYENELVFLLGAQIYAVHESLYGRQYLRMKQQRSDLGASPGESDDLLSLKVRWADIQGVFTLDRLAQEAVDKAGVRIAYAAGYDPRGAISYFLRVQKKYSAKTPLPWAERLDVIRDEIAKLAPLRDPIVTSQAFEIFEASLKKSNGRKKNRDHSKDKPDARRTTVD